MYQRARYGLMIIWVEATGWEQTVALNSNPELWEGFKTCWAFLKSWSDTAGAGDAVNVVTFLMRWKELPRGFEASTLLPPPLHR